MLTVPASDRIAAALKVEPGAATVALRRLRYADDEPIAVMENHLPADLLGLTEDELTGHGLYELLRRAGIALRTAEQTIGARRATAPEARLLDEPRGGTLLTMERTVLGDAGRPVEFGSHLYRASRYSFEMTLTAQ